MKRRKWLLAAGSVLLILTAALLGVYRYHPRVLLRAAVSLQRAGSGFECRSVQVRGWNLRYLDSDPRAAAGHETILLVHGFGESKDRCIQVAEGLADDYRVLALDLPGFGESAIRLDQEYCVSFYVDVILSFLDELEIGSLNLVGYSMGGLLAAKAAAQAPHRVRTLTLLAPAGLQGERLSEVEKTVVEDGEIPLTYRSRDALDHLVRLNFNHDLELPDFVIRAVLAEGRERADVHELIFCNLFDPDDAEEFAQEIATLEPPTLLIWGTADQILDVSAADRWSEINPRIRVVKLSRVGHALIHQVANRVQDEVRSHIRTNAPGTRQ